MYWMQLPAFHRVQLTCYIFWSLHVNCLRSSQSHDNCTNYEKKLFWNTLDNSLTMAAAVICKGLVYCNCFSQRNSRSVLKLQDMSGETREALVDLLGPGSAVCSVVWGVGCKAGWQVGLINGCSVAVSIQTPAPPPPPVSWSISGVRARRVTGRHRPLTSCVMQPVNSCWTCSVAHNVGWCKSSQYDRYDTPSIGSNTIPIR